LELLVSVAMEVTVAVTATFKDMAVSAKRKYIKKADLYLVGLFLLKGGDLKFTSF
jgi:histone H3/H4